MDMRQLRFFVAIAEEGSLSKAAERVHVAQPALSQHMRNMELDLGTELLFRSSRGVQLTEAGGRLLIEARKLTAACRTSSAAARRSRPARCGSACQAR